MGRIDCSSFLAATILHIGPLCTEFARFLSAKMLARRMVPHLLLLRKLHQASVCSEQTSRRREFGAKGAIFFTCYLSWSIVPTVEVSNLRRRRATQEKKFPVGCGRSDSKYNQDEKRRRSKSRAPAQTFLFRGPIQNWNQDQVQDTQSGWHVA